MSNFGFKNAAALLAVCTAFAAPAAAQLTHSDPLIQILGTASNLGSADPVEMRDAAYASCLMFGADSEQAQGVFGQDGWIKTDDSDAETTIMAPAGMEEDLFVLIGTDSTCSVWSASTGTEIATKVTWDMMKLTGGNLSSAPDEDGCPLHTLETEDGGIVAFQVISGSGDMDCVADKDSSLSVISFLGAQE